MLDRLPHDASGHTATLDVKSTDFCVARADSSRCAAAAEQRFLAPHREQGAVLMSWAGMNAQGINDEGNFRQ